MLLNGFLEFTADVIRTGWNVDKLPPSHQELIPLVRSHRAPEPPVPTSLVPDEVARFEKRRSLPVRPSWLPGGEAVTALVAATERRLVVPAPEAGWLTLFSDEPKERIEELVDGWSMMTAASLAAARVPEYRRANVVVTFHPEKIAKVGQVGVHVAEDLRPTWTVVRRVLALGKPPVRVHWEKLRLGGTAEQGYLVLSLVEVAP